MKNIFFTLIMATSTALFALPSDSSLAIAQDSSMNLNENVEAKHHNISNRTHRSGNNNEGRGCRVCPTGPTGPAGAAGSGVTAEFGDFFAKASITYPAGTVISLDNRSIASANVQPVADITFAVAAGQPGVTPTAVAISSVGIYQVTFGASIANALGASSVVQLRLNGATLGRTTIELEDHLTSLTTFISVDANALANGQAGAALLEIFAVNQVALGSQGNASDDVLAYLNINKISDHPVVNP